MLEIVDFFVVVSASVVVTSVVVVSGVSVVETTNFSVCVVAAVVGLLVVVDFVREERIGGCGGVGGVGILVVVGALVVDFPGSVGNGKISHRV